MIIDFPGGVRGEARFGPFPVHTDQPRLSRSRVGVVAGFWIAAVQANGNRFVSLLNPARIKAVSEEYNGRQQNERQIA